MHRRTFVHARCRAHGAVHGVRPVQSECDVRSPAQASGATALFRPRCREGEPDRRSATSRHRLHRRRAAHVEGGNFGTRPSRCGAMLDRHGFARAVVAHGSGKTCRSSTACSTRRNLGHYLFVANLPDETHASRLTAFALSPIDQPRGEAARKHKSLAWLTTSRRTS